jgi:hypothetical protein
MARRGGRVPGSGRKPGTLNRKSLQFRTAFQEKGFDAVGEFVAAIQEAKTHVKNIKKDPRAKAHFWNQIAKNIASTFSFQYPQLKSVDWNVGEQDEGPPPAFHFTSQQLVQVFIKTADEIKNKDPAIIEDHEKEKQKSLNPAPTVSQPGRGSSLAKTRRNSRGLVPRSRKQSGGV